MDNVVLLKSSVAIPLHTIARNDNYNKYDNFIFFPPLIQTWNIKSAEISANKKTVNLSAIIIDHMPYELFCVI